MPVCNRTRMGAVYLCLAAQLCPTLSNPMTVACLFLSMDFSKQKYWSG